MAKRTYPTDVLSQAQTVLSAWSHIGVTVKLGNLVPDNLLTEITQATQLDAKMSSLEAQLTDVRNQRDVMYVDMWDKLKRVRSGAKANYGDDSSEYELVGGTRRSERKPRTRKVTA